MHNPTTNAKDIRAKIQNSCMDVWVYVFQSVCVCVSAKWWSQLATRRINRTSTLRFHTNITHFIVLAFLPTHPSPPHLCNYNGHTLCMNALLHRLSANAAVAKWHSAKQAFAMNATCLRDTHTCTWLLYRFACVLANICKC